MAMGVEMASSKVTLCGHCGKRAVFHERASGTQYGAELDDPYTTHYDGQTLTTWRILECAVCAKPTFVEETVVYYYDVDNVQKFRVVNSAETTVLYPEAKAAKTPLTNLPETIEKRYKATLKVQDIEPRSCAVLAGVTLEAVCNHENATGRTLAAKINNLVNSDRIPPTLAQMARQLKQLRNLGAHDAKDEITEEDVPIILDFLEAILEYLYVAPAKVAAVQARLNRMPIAAPQASP